MDEGCIYLVLVLIAIAAVLAIVFYILLGVALGIGYLGMTIVLAVDFISAGFTWVGVSSPVIGWMLFGLLAGLTFGLAKGLKKAGRRSDAWKVYSGAAGLTTLLALGSYAAYPPEADVSSVLSPSRPAATTATNASPAGITPADAAGSPARAVQAPVRVVAGTNHQFEVRINRGSVGPDAIDLHVRETSVNYSGGWIAWRDVIAASYVTDSLNNRYYPNTALSSGWDDIDVRPGGYREGRIVFSGQVPQRVRQLTLHFAYVPQNQRDGFARVNFTIR